MDALTAAKDWKDDGENDMDEYVAPKVINETTGVSYPDLTTAWNEAANDDVILIYEDQTIGRFDVYANTHVTIRGEGDVVIKRKWGHTGLLFCVNQENAVVDIENVTIDGGGVTNSGVSIESSGVNSKVNLKNVVLNEMYSTNNQGLISIKSKASAGVSKTEEVPATVADVNVNEKEDGWKEVEADEFDYQVPANISSVDFKAVKNGKECGIVTLAAIGGTTAVEVVEAEAEEGIAEYYNLQGVKVENPSEGLYIRKVGNKVSKVIVK